MTFRHCKIVSLSDENKDSTYFILFFKIWEVIYSLSADLELDRVSSEIQAVDFCLDKPCQSVRSSIWILFVESMFPKLRNIISAKMIHDNV